MSSAVEARREIVFGSVFPKPPEVELHGSLKQSWGIAVAWLAPSRAVLKPDARLIDALSDLSNHDKQGRLIEWFLSSIQTHFFKKLLPEIKQAEQDRGVLEDVVALLTTYYETSLRKLTTIEANQATIRQFQRDFHALTNYALQTFFWAKKLEALFHRHVLVSPHSSSSLQSLSIDFRKTCSRFNTIGLGVIAEKMFAEVLVAKITTHVRKVYSNKWETSVLEDIRRWVSNMVCMQVEEVLSEMNEDWSVLLVDVAVSALCSLRIEELFDIIVDFPASIPALSDLTMCLKGPQQRAKVIQGYENACTKRLLHPGADTSDIIVQYMSTIQAFLILDPKSILLDRVARPIRRYLREREDTISCVISGLAGQEDSPLVDLNEELERSRFQYGAKHLDGGEDDFDDPLWTPDPMDAPEDSHKTRSSAAGDIIGSLISLYDSRDLFVKEIQKLIANRLLAPSVVFEDIQREIRNVELLKLRFGDSELQMCDVMLRDMIDSQRIDVAVHAVTSKEVSNAVGTNLHSFVLSKLFWPTFRNEGLKLPEEVMSELDRFANGFNQVRSTRTLTFLPHLGHVDVELSLEDRVIEVRVTPAQACLVFKFQERPFWSLDTLSQELERSQADLRRDALYWISQGVLTEHVDGYLLLERDQGHRRNVAPMESTAGAIETKEEGEAEEMRVYWSFVVGMLTNLGSLPLERVQGMLKTFVPTGYNKTQEQLHDFLQLMIEEEALEFIGGMYRLKL